MLRLLPHPPLPALFPCMRLRWGCLLTLLYLRYFLAWDALRLPSHPPLPVISLHDIALRLPSHPPFPVLFLGMTLRWGCLLTLLCLCYFLAWDCVEVAAPPSFTWFISLHAIELRLPSHPPLPASLPYTRLHWGCCLALALGPSLNILYNFSTNQNVFKLYYSCH